MDPAEYGAIFEVETRHWWYQGMERISRLQIEEHYAGRNDLQILDAGCGTGGSLMYLGRYGVAAGCDLSPLALAYCRRRGLRRLALAGVGHLPYADEAFDLVTSFDVLYHQQVSDVQAALAECYRVLRTGGRLVLRLPAYDKLRGLHDLVVHTARRFTTGGVRRALEATHFQVEKVTYANSILFPAALGSRLAERILPVRQPGSDIHSNPEWLDSLLAQALYLEARWLTRFGLPFGLTVLAVGRKDGS